MSQKCTFLPVAIEALLNTHFTKPLEEWNISDLSIILTVGLTKHDTIIQTLRRTLWSVYTL